MEPLEASKSQRKRDLRALFTLGEQIADLPAKELATIPLNEEQLETVQRIRNMPRKSARQRELRYLTKQLDRGETQAIESAIAELQQGRRKAARDFRALEQLRDLLLDDPTAGIAQTMETYPAADRQKLIQFARQHKQELQRQKPPTAARKLFRYLRELAG